MSKTKIFHPSRMGLLFRFIKYNLKIVFGNKFVYFLGAALIFYLLITSISLFGADSVSMQGVYFS